MTTIETVLIFGVVPLAAAGLLALLVFGANARRAPRYRPGRPFVFSPVWFLSAPDSKTDAPAFPAGVPAATKKGGARGTW